LDFLEIAGRRYGAEHKTLLVAEIGLGHDGSLGLAHSYVDAVAEAGADAVKFQAHLAPDESTKDEEFRVPFSYEDASRYEYWQRTGFSPEQWQDLAEHAREMGLLFLCSPFSLGAAKMLEDLGVPAWKVASGELANQPLLEYMAGTKKPMIISSGMSSWAELDQVMAFCKKRGGELALLQCSSAYPVKLNQVGLNVMEEMARRYQVPVGLSDHSGTPFPSLAAMARGAALVEVHAVFSKQMFGPDSMASLTLEELAFLAQARDGFHQMDTPLDKDAFAQGMAGMKELFGRSLALRRGGQAGLLLTEEHLTLKKPGSGILPSEINKVVGRRLAHEVAADRLLKWEDLEDNLG
jgi:N,N'-diacetyllegionaminate synthase